MTKNNPNRKWGFIFLYKSPLSIWIICCQFFFTNCRIIIHYFLPYLSIYLSISIYIYIYIYIYNYIYIYIYIYYLLGNVPSWYLIQTFIYKHCESILIHLFLC